MMNMSDKVHGLKDRKKSEETRRKTRKTNKNKAYSDLSKKELTPWMKRKRNTEEVKRKLTKYFNRPEEREKLSINRLKQKFSIKDTKPEKILQKICKDAKIQFVKQKSFKLDNYEIGTVNAQTISTNTPTKCSYKLFVTESSLAASACRCKKSLEIF